MPVRRIGLLAALALLVGVYACANADSASPDAAGVPHSTFGQLQRTIFDRQCVSCHSRNGMAARESELILEPAVSYANLIGARPANADARADGLVRVMPGNANTSLLFHKLNWSPEHHSQRNYGNPMPLGGEPLTLGQVEFVRRWIAAGAPRTGFVVDSALLQDTRRQNVDDFRPLPPPASGFQLRIDSFAVSPNFERELFLYRRVGNSEPIYVQRVETRMRLNGHHLLIMTFKDSTPAYVMPQHDVIRDIRAANGAMQYENMLVMGWHQFFAGANTRYEDKRLPDGVALRLPAQASLDLNSHFVNGSARPIAGEAYINLHTIEAAQVQHVAQPFYMYDTSFELPPYQRTTITRTFLLDRPLTVLMLTSHNHELGEVFEMRVANGPQDGALVYRSTDWRHPLIHWLAQPLQLQPGQGFTVSVTYNNVTGRTIRHGLLSTDEMLVMRGYGY